ncbi:MAG: ribonuclease R [Bacteroidetes bacterium]|nr:ribonuclease R [Bacteroidota bacterium]
MKRKFKNKEQGKKKSFFFEEILKVLSKSPNKALNYKQIAAELQVTDHSQRLLINSILEELKNRGTVSEPERGKFKLKSSEKFITGKVDMTTGGTAYIISEETEEDVLVTPKKTLNALHGDIVKVRLFPKMKGKQEGEIIEVIQRSKTEFVGTIQISPRFAFLVPSIIKVNVDIYIPLEKLNGAKDGQKAIARIIEWPKNGVNPIGEIIDVLGNVGENNTEMHAILAEYGLPYEFPKDVERAADLIPIKITGEEIAKRRDFREITTFTIDPVDAKDFDDALSIRKLKNGNWEIGVHIADVSHYVKENSMIDKEAVSRATSVYLVDRVVPMLPEVLSNNVCSLRPNEEKLCFSSVFEMTDNAEVVNEWFGRTIINSNRRFTYEEAQRVIETEEGDFTDEILTLNRLAKILRANRFKTGSIAFEKMEVKFHLDEVGNPTGVYFKVAKDSNQLIEDFMLLANRKVAEFVGKKKKESKVKNQDQGERQTESQRPFVYRIHDKPNPDKLANFAEFVGKFGYKLNIKNINTVADSMNNLLKEVNEKKEAGMIEMLAIRTMAKAVYTTKNIGHYGLGFDYYTHFTSPIRRYPDVMVHRLLQHYLDGGKNPDIEKLEEQCKHSSDMEKLAADAERSSIKYKQVQFLTDKIGQEFDGIISGVTEWGVFIEIIENHCEGMVRLRELQDDNYYFDEENYCLRGRKFGKILTLGDKVRIVIKRADLIKKQLDFGLVEVFEEDKGDRGPSKKFYNQNKSDKPFNKQHSNKQQQSKKQHFNKQKPGNRPQDKPFEKPDADAPSEKKEIPKKPKTGNDFVDEWGFEV